METNLYEVKNRVEEIIKSVGYPVAYSGSWDDDCVEYVVRGKDSFITLDVRTSEKGTIDLYRTPLKLKRVNKKFFMATQGRKYVIKRLVSFGRGWVDDKKQLVNYANIYKWLLQNKNSLSVHPNQYR